MMMNRFPQQQVQKQSKNPEKKKQVRMSISFKDDEIWLYEKLCEHSSPSAWIKDLLKIYYKQ